MKSDEPSYCINHKTCSAIRVKRLMNIDALLLPN